MKIPDKLQKFLKYRFNLLLKEESRFLELRKKIGRQRKRLERSEEYKNADDQKREEMRDVLKKKWVSELMPGFLDEGKTRNNRNSYIAMAYYLISKENPKIEGNPLSLKNNDTYEWIAKFLIERQFKKQSFSKSNIYTSNDIKRVVSEFDDMYRFDYDYITSLFDHMYSEFQEPHQ